MLMFTASNIFAQVERPSLTAVYNLKSGIINLGWSMIDYDDKTGYIILKSTDGKNWFELVRDKILKKYTSDDSYTFDDRNIRSIKNLYRVMIINTLNTTVALSDIVVASKAYKSETITVVRPPEVKNNTTLSTSPFHPENEKNSWNIYPNPVHDQLTLQYKGSKPVQGCINVVIVDMNGKVVTRYRCASTTKVFQIPVDNLIRGTYTIQLSVLNEILMSQRFIKQ